MYKEITTKEFREKFLSDPDLYELIDVREPYEFNELRIKWAKLISMWELWNKLSEINWDKEVIFMCRTWSRSWYVTNLLNEKWYNSINLAGWISMLQMICDECLKRGDISKDYFEK